MNNEQFNARRAQANAEAIAKYHADLVASEDDTVIEELSEEEVKNEIGRLMGGINQRLAA